MRGGRWVLAAGVLALAAVACSTSSTDASPTDAGAADSADGTVGQCDTPVFAKCTQGVDAACRALGCPYRTFADALAVCGLVELQHCGDFDIAGAASGDVGTLYYFDATTGALVARVASTLCASTCAGGPSTFVPPTCTPTPISCPIPDAGPGPTRDADPDSGTDADPDAASDADAD